MACSASAINTARSNSSAIVEVDVNVNDVSIINVLSCSACCSRCHKK